jgi:uncharacterized Zn ribbon protein
MKCFKCDSEKEASFFEEVFECKCGEKLVFNYNLCPDCGMSWRSVNDEVSDDSAVYFNDLMSFASMLSGDLTEEEETILKNMEIEVGKIEKINIGDAAMTDYVHKCLKCNSAAHETEQDKYVCDVCGFEWEITRFE